jgi:hypothetical protein
MQKRINDARERIYNLGARTLVHADGRSLPAETAISSAEYRAALAAGEEGGRERSKSIPRLRFPAAESRWKFHKPVRAWRA